VVKVGDEAKGVLCFELLKDGDGVGVKRDIDLPGLDAFDGGTLKGFGIWMEIQLLAEVVNAALVNGEVWDMGWITLIKDAITLF